MISVAEFRKGDRVWFKVLAKVLDVRDPDARVITVKEEGGQQRLIDLDATDVELQAPFGWPPQLEDVWVMRGMRWFVIANGSAIALINAYGDQISAADAAVNTRNLALSERKQQDGGTS